MELQFQKTVIPCLRKVLRDVQKQEQTQEIRLPDGMPDIGQILASWGQPVIRGKEWYSSDARVSGGVMAWVLYLPEDGSEPRCVEGWIPFQIHWDFREPQKDGILHVFPVVNAVESRSVSARKLTVRAVVSVMAEGWIDDETTIYQPDQLPDDICLLRNTYPIQMPVEANEKAFMLEDTVMLPQSQPAMEKLIRYQLQPVLTEQKVMADKIVFRGDANLHVLYRGADGELHSWDFEIPFSQFGELEQEHSPDCMAQVSFAVTNLELERGENGEVRFKIGLTGQYMVCDRRSITLVEDAYSPFRQVVNNTEELQLPMVLDQTQQTLHTEGCIKGDVSRIADVAFYMEHPCLHPTDMGICGEMNGNFQTLYYNEDGRLNCDVSHWENQWNVDASSHANVEMSADLADVAQGAENAMQGRLTAPVQMQAFTWAQSGLPMITGMEAGEIKELDLNRPSLVLRQAGEDRLWDLAKQEGSTVDLIKKANQLDTEPDDDRWLLVPVC